MTYTECMRIISDCFHIRYVPVGRREPFVDLLCSLRSL